MKEQEPYNPVAAYRQAFDEVLKIDKEISQGDIPPTVIKEKALKYLDAQGNYHSPQFNRVREKVEFGYEENISSAKDFQRYREVKQSIIQLDNWNPLIRLLSDQGELYVMTAGKDTAWKRKGKNYKRFAKKLENLTSKGKSKRK